MPPEAPKPLIAVIDDDPTLRLLCKTILQDEADLVFGANAREALHLMRTHKPDLVLLDDIMPDGPTGLSFLEDLKNEPSLSDIPVIMLTMSGAQDELLRGLAAGASDYLVKPATPTNLKRAIRAVLAGRRKHRVLLALEEGHLKSELAEKMEELNCVLIPLPEKEESLAPLLQDPALLVLLEAARAETLSLPLDEKTQKATFLLLGPASSQLAPLFASSRTALLPTYETAADILFAAGRLLAAQKNRGPKA